MSKLNACKNCGCWVVNVNNYFSEEEKKPLYYCQCVVCKVHSYAYEDAQSAMYDWNKRMGVL